MTGVRDTLLAVGAGVVAFALVAVGVTAALDPYVWPSALVGLPVGLLAGVLVAFLAHRRLSRSGASHGAL